MSKKQSIKMNQGIFFQIEGKNNAFKFFDIRGTVMIVIFYDKIKSTRENWNQR